MPVLVKVELAKANVPSANGRVYPAALLRQVAEQTQDGLIPVTPSSRNTLVSDIMGVLVSAEMDGDTLNATLRLVDTENGLNCQKLLEAGYKGCFCMSGRGTVDDHGVVQNDYQMDCVVIDWLNLMKDRRLREVLLKKFKFRHDLTRTAQDP
jgi:hypothetical protein